MKKPKEYISEAQLNAINDAIFVLQTRGHSEAAAQLEAIWEQEFSEIGQSQEVAA